MRKITPATSSIFQGVDSCLYSGNLDTRQDWGCARDYRLFQWLALPQEELDDSAIAAGVQHLGRGFLSRVGGYADIEREIMDKKLETLGAVVTIREPCQARTKYQAVST